MHFREPQPFARPSLIFYPADSTKSTLGNFMRIVLALVALCFAFVTVTGAEEHLPVIHARPGALAGQLRAAHR